MPGAATHLSVVGTPLPLEATAGVPYRVSVTALDASGAVATGYLGTVTFSSSDARAGLPADYTFAAGDAGTATFVVSLLTVATSSVTATDTVTGTITGGQPGIVVAAPGRSVVVGNAGGLPVAGFRFDGDDRSPFPDEAQIARFLPEHATLTTDVSVCYGQVRLSGGAASLLPDGAKITALVVINGVYKGPPSGSGPYGPPYQSEARDDWADALPLITWASSDEKSGGLAYLICDGALYPWSPSLQAPHLCLAVHQDQGTLYVGTPHGVYSRLSDPGDRTTAWARVGGAFGRRVTALAVHQTTGESPSPVLWALVQDKDAGGTVYHGLYRYPAYAGAASSPHLEGDWQPVVRAGELVAMAASGPDDVWYVAKADGARVQHWASGVRTALALPAGGAATALSFVNAPALGKMAVFASASGAAEALYYTASGDDGVTWSSVAGALAGADPGGALADQDGNRVGVNGVSGSNLTLLNQLDPTAGTGAYVAAWACCTAGLFWTDTLDPPAWKAVTASNGLDDTALVHLAAGQHIHVLGVPQDRLWAANAERLFVSHTGSNLWEEAAPRVTVGLGPILSALTFGIDDANGTGTGHTLPLARVKTIGPQAGSPIGDLASTHIVAPGLLPSTWWLQRTLNKYGSYEWTLHNPDGGARLVAHQVSDLSAETSERLALLRASERLLGVAVRWLGSNSSPQVTLSLQTRIATQEGAARLLRASMRCPVRYHGSLLARASGGAAIATTYVGLDDVPLFVAKVSFEGASDLGPLVCVATVDLSNRLSDPRDFDDLAAALLEDVHNSKKKHAARR